VFLFPSNQLRKSDHLNQARQLKDQGVDAAALTAGEAALASAFNIKFALNKCTLGKITTSKSWDRAGRLDDPAFDLLAILGFTRAEIDAANNYCRGAMTPKGAAFEARASLRLGLRQPIWPHRLARSLGRQPHPHDGGGATLYLGSDLEDDQHAERGDGRGLQGRQSPICCRGGSG